MQITVYSVAVIAILRNILRSHKKLVTHFNTEVIMAGF